MENHIGEKRTNGEILVEVNGKQPATKVLCETRMADLAIRVTPHLSLNTSQGVVSEPDLLKETDPDFLAGITAGRRITIRRDDKEFPN